MNIVLTFAFVWRRKFLVVLMLLLFACRLHSAENPGPTDVKLPVLKVGNEVYSNVTVTAVTATDIYFTHSGGMGNAKLEHLDPALQKKFHFDSKKAHEQESKDQKATLSFQANLRLQSQGNTNKTRVSGMEEAEPYISVQAPDATIQYHRYDPIYRRPRNLTEQGARFDCAFNFDADFTIYPVPATNGGTFAFRIDAASVSIGMDMSITEPSTPTEKLENHLQGHKRIYEHFYALGSAAAERAARVIGSGWRINPDGNDLDSAKASFLQTAKENAKMEYKRYTAFPAYAATRYYDELTDYGRNLTDTDQAVQEAIQRYEAPIPGPSSDTTPAIWNETTRRSK